MTAPKIRCSYYTDGDYIVTVNGRMVGQCLSKADAFGCALQINEHLDRMGDSA